MFASAARPAEAPRCVPSRGGHGGDPLQKLARHHNALVTERERFRRASLRRQNPVPGSGLTTSPRKTRGPGLGPITILGKWNDNVLSRPKAEEPQAQQRVGFRGEDPT